MTKQTNTRALYIVISSENTYFAYRYLSKVENKTGINRNTLAQHFSRHKKPYINDKYTVIKVYNVDLSLG